MRNEQFAFPLALAMVIASLPGAARAASTTCSTSTVCSEAVNTYSGGSGGVAIHGEANGGIGVRGTSVTNTGFYGASGSGVLTAPGVEGESTNLSGTDAGGGFGLGYFAPGGHVPGYGAVGYGQHAGFSGVTNTGSTKSSFVNSGVFGSDGSGASSYNAGMVAVSSNNAGLLAESNGAVTQSIFGMEPVGVYAVAEPATNASGAIGVFSESTSYPLEAYNSKNAMEVFLAHPSYTFLGGLVGNGILFKTFSVDFVGNGFLAGSLTTMAGTYVRKTGTSGAARIAYGAQMAAPEIEDVGEATLTNGRAFVSIDAALADSIDMRHAYHVFVTPDGDCKGLYVEQRTPGGFVVRELQGGRSSLQFEYRIVAKPIDENGERLALAPPLEHPAVSGLRRAGRMPAQMTPDERLRRDLGPQKYAEAVAALTRRMSGR